MLRSTSLAKSKQIHNRIALLLLSSLLFLRLPFFTGITSFTSVNPYLLSPVFELSTYLLTVSLIWWERARLADFHIDTLAIAIIIFLKPIETLILATFQNSIGTILPLAFPRIPSLVIWITAIGLLLALLHQQPKVFNIQRKTIIWLIIGVLAGIVTATLLAYPLSFQIEGNNHPDTLPPFNLDLIFIQGFVYQLGFAAVTEEPLFRGFLWGYLRKARWREVWIWLFQAGLFWLGHIYYLNKSPILFWLIVPINALVFGILAWRSRSIATSMVVHAIGNGLTFYLANVILFYRH